MKETPRTSENGNFMLRFSRLIVLFGVDVGSCRLTGEQEVQLINKASTEEISSWCLCLLTICILINALFVC